MKICIIIGKISISKSSILAVKDKNSFSNIVLYKHERKCAVLPEYLCE